MRILAENIKRRRKELGLSQEKLAEIVGLSTNHIARIETGTRTPSLGILDRIAEALGTTVSELTAEQGAEPLKADERITALLKNISAEDAEFLAREVAEWVHRLSKKGS
ncbi:MAG: helix-turn-helix domain-containing protein [Armatimonadota bacterium]